MTAYDVHAYATVRVKVTNVRADSHDAAMRTVADEIDFDRLFKLNWPEGKEPLRITDIEYAEEVTGYLVDEQGDEEERQRSREYDGDFKPIVPSVPRLVDDADPDLVAALWWFIENATDDLPGRTERFFRLRERVREHQAGETGIAPAVQRQLMHGPKMLAALKGLKEWAALLGGWDAPAWEDAAAAIADAEAAGVKVLP